MSLESMKILYIVLFVFAVILLVIAGVLAVVFDVKLIVSILSGSKARREIKRIRAEKRRKDNAYLKAYYTPGRYEEKEISEGEEGTTYLEAATTYLPKA